MIKDGFIKFRDYRTYYKIYNSPNSKHPPLVVLHGGPGYPHYYLENLGALAKKGHPVVFYDQLGCGKSDRPNDPSLWTIDLFIEELNTLRKTLGLPIVNLFGHSWGGTLALEYMFTKPGGVQKVILADPLVDTKLWVKEAKKLIGELPKWAAEIMKKSEAKGTTDSFEYKEAYALYAKRHICRVEPYPKAAARSNNDMGHQVYNVM